MEDYKKMEVSILSMLYFVNGLLRKMKGQEFVASAFCEFIDIFEELQRNYPELQKRLNERLNHIEDLEKDYIKVNEERKSLINRVLVLTVQIDRLNDKG
jgi:predicted nuclease with TOPRIM domain